jgi:hypothetical protein
VWERLVGRCLNIVELSWNHSVMRRLLIHRSDPLTWPRATISVTLSAFPNQLVCVQSENTSGGLHVFERLVGRCLNIVELSWNHSVMRRLRNSPI